MKAVNMELNKADAPNAARTPRFHFVHHRRGVGDLQRWAALRTWATTST